MARTKKPVGETCRWRPDEEAWWTACGEGFVLSDGTPEQNSMKFCPYCGRKLKTERQP